MIRAIVLSACLSVPLPAAAACVPVNTAREIADALEQSVDATAKATLLSMRLAGTEHADLAAALVASLVELSSPLSAHARAITPNICP